MGVAVSLLLLVVGALGPVAGPVAVLPAHDAEGREIDDDRARVVLVRLVAEAPGAQLVEEAAVRSVLDGLARQGARCIDPGCFARVGLFAGASVVLVPIVEGERTTLWRIDVAGERLVDEHVAADAGVLEAVAAGLVAGGPAPLLFEQEQEAQKEEVVLRPAASAKPAVAATEGSAPAAPDDGGLPMWVGLGVGGGAVGGAVVLAALSAGAFGVRLFGGGAFDLGTRAAASVVGDVVGVAAVAVLVVGGGVGGGLLWWSVVDE